VAAGRSAPPRRFKGCDLFFAANGTYHDQPDGLRRTRPARLSLARRQPDLLVARVPSPNGLVMNLAENQPSSR
jgi:hypothetical protein